MHPGTGPRGVTAGTEAAIRRRTGSGPPIDTRDVARVDVVALADVGDVGADRDEFSGGQPLGAVHTDREHVAGATHDESASPVTAEQLRVGQVDRGPGDRRGARRW